MFGQPTQASPKTQPINQQERGLPTSGRTHCQCCQKYLGHAQCGELGLQVLKLAQQLGLAFAAELVGLDFSCRKEKQRT